MMRTFTLTYYNTRTGNYSNINVQGMSLESVTAAEHEALGMFQRVNPGLTIHSITEVAA